MILGFIASKGISIYFEKLFGKTPQEIDYKVQRLLLLKCQHYLSKTSPEVCLQQ